MHHSFRSWRMPRPLIAAFAAVVASVAGPTLARADVISSMLYTAEYADTTGNPIFFQPAFTSLPGTYKGQLQVTTTVVGLMSDPTRDGASIAPSANPGVVTGRLGLSGGGLQPVTSVGPSASLASSGSPGAPRSFARFEQENSGATATFTKSATQSVTNLTANRSVLTTTGVAILDANGDGVGITGNTALGNVSLFGVGAGGTPTATVQQGSGFSAAFAGTQISQASFTDSCSVAVPCNQFFSNLAFGLTGGGDAMVALTLMELNGSPTAPAAMMAYGAYTDTELYNCGIQGCDRQSMTLSFQGSGNNDNYAFIIFQQVSTVPEPGSVVLFGTGVVGLVGFVRRRGVLGR